MSLKPHSQNVHGSWQAPPDEDEDLSRAIAASLTENGALTCHTAARLQHLHALFQLQQQDSQVAAVAQVPAAAAARRP